MAENRKPAIVLVDDEEMILTSIRTLLMLEADYDVACFTSPLEAVRHLENNAVDVTVSDYLMPGMTGIQLLAEAKRRQPEAAPLAAAAALSGSIAIPRPREPPTVPGHSGLLSSSIGPALLEKTSAPVASPRRLKPPSRAWSAFPLRRPKPMGVLDPWVRQPWFYPRWKRTVASSPRTRDQSL